MPASLQAAAQGPEPGSFKLSGGISHSDSLEPLPENERVGFIQGSSSSAALTPPSNFTATPPVTTSVSPPVNSVVSPASPALLNPYRTHPPTAVDSASFRNPNYAASSSALRSHAQAQQNASLYSRAPHIDLGQALYKKRIRELSEQNLLAIGTRRTGRVQIKIPPWLAGQWQRTETNELSRKQLPSGKELKPIGKQSAKVTDTFGGFKDRRGNVFMVVPLGAAGAVDRGFAVDYHRVKKYELVLDGTNSAVIKVQASHQVVSKKDKRVVEAYQDEELNRYTLVRDGLVKTDSSVKVFDQFGQAKLITRAVSTERRVKKI
ncbi:hypothetical protein BH11CYA1_BH11CYA1_08290 [soil metagenome]